MNNLRALARIHRAKHKDSIFCTSRRYDVHIKRWYLGGHKVKWIANNTGMTVADVADVLYRAKIFTKKYRDDLRRREKQNVGR